MKETRASRSHAGAGRRPDKTMVMIPWATRVLIILCCGGILLWLTSCSGDSDEKKAQAEQAELVEKFDTPEALYEKAQITFSQSQFKQAIKDFEEVERQHPYSPLASKAQVMAAYAAYRAEEFEEAILISERFVKLHPTHESAPYAFYLKALSAYDQITDVGRDQSLTDRARTALREVVARYPNSEYAQDAKLKLDLTYDHLAGKEMEIGRYYLGKQEYVAAINRFRKVYENYQTTSHIPEALHRLVEVYSLLGVREEAEKYAAVLGYNYPGSKWYRYSYRILKGEDPMEEMTDEAAEKAKESPWYAVF